MASNNGPWVARDVLNKDGDVEQTSAVRWRIRVLVALLVVAGALAGWFALSTDAATTNLMRAKVATALTDGLQDVAVDGPRVLVAHGAGPRHYAPLINGHPEIAFVVYKDALGELNQELNAPRSSSPVSC